MVSSLPESADESGLQRSKKTLSLRLIAVLLLVGAVLPTDSSPSQDAFQVGYAVLTPAGNSGNLAAAALFRLEGSSGVLISEAAIAAAPSLRSGRIFVDQEANRTGVALANPQSQAVGATLTLRDSDGLLTGMMRQVIPAKQNLSLFVDELFDVPEGFTGSMTFVVDPEPAALAAVTIRLGVNNRGEPLLATLPVASLDGPQPEGASLILPHLGAGGPLSSQILLINPTDEAIEGEIHLTASDGTSLEFDVQGQTLSSLDFHLPGAGTFKVDLTSSGEVVQGFAEIIVAPGHGLPEATAVFQFRDEQSLLVSEAGVAAIAPRMRSRLFVDSVRTRTGVALAYPNGSERATIVFELYDRNGFFIATTSREIEAPGHFAVFVDELFPDLSGISFTGLLEINSDAPIVPVSLKLSTNQRRDLILTTLPFADLDLPASDQIKVLPQVAFGIGFSTRIFLINTQPASLQEGQIAFVRSDGTPFEVALAGLQASQLDISLPKRGGQQLRPGNVAQPGGILVNPLSPSPSEVIVNQGEMLGLSPLVIDDQGVARDDFSFTFDSVTPAIASVDEAGNVQGLEAGFSTLTVTTGEILETATITVAAVSDGLAGFEITGVAQDLSSQLYVSNSKDHTILLSRDLMEPPELYAGMGGVAGLKDDRRLQALFRNPAFIALDQANGDLYVSDRANHVIRRITPGRDGQVEIISGSSNPGHQDGPLSEALFDNPQGLVLDSQGNLWVADSGSHTIRRISLLEGRVVTMAGSPYQPGAQDGVGAAAAFDSPAGLAVESEPLALQLERELRGEPPPPVSVLVADQGNGRIRRVFEDGRVETLGAASTSAATPHQTAAPLLLDSPVGIATDPAGRIYVSEPARNRVTVLLKDGTQIPLTQPNSLTAPRDIAIREGGQVAVTVADRLAQLINFGAPEVDMFDNLAGPNDTTRVTVRGRNFSPDTQLVFRDVEVQDLTILDTTRIEFILPNDTPTGNSTVTLINRGGTRQELVQIDLDGRVVGRGFLNFSYLPRDLSLDASGNLFLLSSIELFGEISSSSVDKLLAGSNLAVNVVAGSDSAEGIPARQAGLEDAGGISNDLAGNLYIAETSRHRIRRVSVADGLIQTIAGSGAMGSDGDGGPALQALLNSPQDIVVDRKGNLWIADTLNHRVRRVDTVSGAIETVAGNGLAGFSGDGGLAVAASLNGPLDLAFDRQGNLYIADGNNHRIRRLDVASGRITTVAGNGDMEFSGDGGSALSTGLDFPLTIALDADGNILIGGGRRVRRVDAASGTIETVAGTGESRLFEESGVPATEFPIQGPATVLIDSGGNLLILEAGDFGLLLKVGARTGLIVEIPYSPPDAT